MFRYIEKDWSAPYQDNLKLSEKTFLNIATNNKDARIT